MSSNESTYKMINATDQKKISRRTFFTKSVGCTAGLSLLTFPGIITELLAAKGNKLTKEIFKELDEKVNKFMPMYKYDTFSKLLY